MEPKEAIDRFLATVGEGMCFPQTMKVYAPTCEGKCLPAVEKLNDSINRLFGGSTTYDMATGCWLDADATPRKMVCEPVKVIEVGHNCATEADLLALMDAILLYATSTKQQALSIKNGSFFVQSTKELGQRASLARADIL